MIRQKVKSFDNFIQPFIKTFHFGNISLRNGPLSPANTNLPFAQRPGLILHQPHPVAHGSHKFNSRKHLGKQLSVRQCSLCLAISCLSCNPLNVLFIFRCIWRLCFLCVCLPSCYPCYLSRTLRRQTKVSESQRVFTSTAPPPLRQGHPEACRGRGSRGRRRGRVGATTESPPGGKSWQQGNKATSSSNVSLLFLESPSSRQLLGEWQYFHLTDTQEEAEVIFLFLPICLPFFKPVF